MKSSPPRPALETNSLSSAVLEQRLWVTAREIARERDAEYSVPCAANVKDFIRAGVRNMEREARLKQEDWEEAESNLHVLIGAMVQAVSGEKTVPGKPRALREGALVQAKRLCPLWPFS